MKINRYPLPPATAVVLMMLATACDPETDASESSCTSAKCDAADDEQHEPETPHAVAPKGTCALDEVRRIDRPIVPGDPNGGTFRYAFRVSPGNDPDAPVIVRIPGGPGGSSIESGRNLGEYPESSTVIFTDPRGVGCNAMLGELPAEAFFDSTVFADDIVAVLEHLDVEDWAIYGTSYGTALGTMTAAIAVDEGLPPPRAVVLEGILGRAFDDAEDEAAKLTEWALVFDDLPAEVQTLLQHNDPLGIDAKTWGRAITTLMTIGSTADTPRVAHASLSALADPATHEAVAAQIRSVGAEGPPAPGQDQLFGVVACREIADLAFSGFALTKGRLAADDVRCKDIERDRSYDAAYWPIDAPIFYVQGTNDPATPMWQTEAHIAKQPHTDRFLMQVDRAGHNPIGFTMLDCIRPLWSAWLSRGDGLADAVEGCDTATTLTVIPADAG